MILADLAAIKARCEAAEPSPWRYEPGIGSGTVWGSRGGSVASHVGSHPYTRANGEFIAHARDDVPALLEAVERLLSMLTDAQTEAEMQAAEVARLREAVEDLKLNGGA